MQFFQLFKRRYIRLRSHAPPVVKRNVAPAPRDLFIGWDRAPDDEKLDYHLRDDEEGI